MGNTAVLLTFDQHGVQNATGIIHRDETAKTHIARLHIDIDHRDMRAKRERAADLFRIGIGREGAIV